MSSLGPSMFAELRSRPKAVGPLHRPWFNAPWFGPVHPDLALLSTAACWDVRMSRGRHRIRILTLSNCQDLYFSAYFIISQFWSGGTWSRRWASLSVVIPTAQVKYHSQPSMKKRGVWLPGCTGDRWAQLLLCGYTLVTQISSLKRWIIYNCVALFLHASGLNHSDCSATAQTSH